MLEIGFMLDDAFRRDPSIAAMNRVYRKHRTGEAETDRAIRDHLGMLYLLEQAKFALLRAAKEGDRAVKGRTAGGAHSRVVAGTDWLKPSPASESERSRVGV